MQQSEIYLSDWRRILFGQVPANFYAEMIIRSVLLYILLFVSMRLLGKRMASQTSRIELAAMVTLAAAIGVPVLSPERGMLPALVIAAAVIFVSRFVARKTA